MSGVQYLEKVNLNLFHSVISAIKTQIFDQFLVVQQSWHLLTNFDFHTAYFMTGFCSQVQSIETKQCCHVGIVEHLENWGLNSKSKRNH